LLPWHGPRPKANPMQISTIDGPLSECCETQCSQIGYTKPDGYFRACLASQDAGKLTTFVAHEKERYAGHVKLVWHADYPTFREQDMPEIQDLNVLPRHRKKGVGTTLIAHCEALASQRTDTIGIGVGLHPGYNNAQRLYTKLGYILDGHGVHYNNFPVKMGASYRFGDDLIIYFTKMLASDTLLDVTPLT
jgi:GNAT superfamily N-acetyltransferase